MTQRSSTHKVDGLFSSIEEVQDYIDTVFTFAFMAEAFETNPSLPIVDLTTGECLQSPVLLHPLTFSALQWLRQKRLLVVLTLNTE